MSGKAHIDDFPDHAEEFFDDDGYGASESAPDDFAQSLRKGAYEGAGKEDPSSPNHRPGRVSIESQIPQAQEADSEGFPKPV